MDSRRRDVYATVMRFVRWVLVSALVCLLLAPSAPSARPKCGAGFRKSCVRKLYRCFDGRGTCTRDFSAFDSEGAVTDCWENGTRATLTGYGAESGTSTLLNRRGRTCRSGVTTWNGFNVAIVYQVKNRTWTIARNFVGDFTVTCPNGDVESHPAAEVQAGGCGPIAECAGGSCAE